MVIVGHSGSLLVAFWSLLVTLVQCGYLLVVSSHLGHFRMLWVAVGRFVIVIGHFGSLWVAVGHCWSFVGRCWSLWVAVGRFLVVIGHFGLLRVVFGHCDLLWVAVWVILLMWVVAGSFISLPCRCGLSGSLEDCLSLIE